MRITYRILLVIIASIIVAPSWGQRYVPTDENSKVEFSIGHKKMGYHTVNGSFKGLSGEIVFDPANLEKSYFNVSIADSTIHTGNNQRDHDLNGAEFFDTKNFSRISIISTRVEHTTTHGIYLLHGDLTIKGITLPIVIAFRVTPARDGSGCVFSGLLTLNRKDYNLGDNNSIDNALTVSISVFAKKD